MDHRLAGLYVLTDTALAGTDHLSLAAELLSAGVRLLQLRDKTMPAGRYLDTARGLVRLCRDAGALFIVNDRVDVALASGADGVHLGQDDLPLSAARRLAGDRLLVGISTHDLEQARAAEAGGADYIGFGPVYETGTKDAGGPRGLEALREVCRRVRIPVAAIGGINAENAVAVRAAGAAMLAVASAVQRPGRIRAAAEDLLRRLEGRERAHGM